MVFHQLLEEFPKFKSPLKLMKTVLWMWRPLIKEHQRMLKLPSRITKEDFQKKRLKNWSNKLKNTRIKMIRSEEKLKLKMVLKVIAQMSNMLSTMKNSKERFQKMTRKMFCQKFLKLNHGFLVIQTLRLKIMKESKKRLKEFTIL